MGYQATTEGRVQASIPAGTTVHLFHPVVARDRLRQGEEMPCSLAVLVRPAQAMPDGGWSSASVTELGTASARLVSWGKDTEVANMAAVKADGGDYTNSERWHRVQDCRFKRKSRPHPLGRNEVITAEAMRDGVRVAVTSAGRKVVLDADGRVLVRLQGPLYQWER